MSALKISLRSIKWAVHMQHVHQSNGRKIRKNTIFTLMEKGRMSYYFQVNSRRQNTLEDTASMYCFLMFDSSLVISHMRWKLKVLQVVSGILRLQMGPINKNIWGSMKSINKPLRKRMQQLHCLMMIYKIVNSTKRRISSPCPRPYYQLPCSSCKRSRQRQHCYDYWEKYRPRGWWVLWVSLLHCKNTTTVH